jgi:hypothetical protein
VRRRWSVGESERSEVNWSVGVVASAAFLRTGEGSAESKEFTERGGRLKTIYVGTRRPIILRTGKILREFSPSPRSPSLLSPAQESEMVEKIGLAWKAYPGRGTHLNEIKH